MLEYFTLQGPQYNMAKVTFVPCSAKNKVSLEAGWQPEAMRIEFHAPVAVWLSVDGRFPNKASLQMLICSDSFSNKYIIYTLTMLRQEGDVFQAIRAIQVSYEAASILDSAY